MIKRPEYFPDDAVLSHTEVLRSAGNREGVMLATWITDHDLGEAFGGCYPEFEADGQRITCLHRIYPSERVKSLRPVPDEVYTWTGRVCAASASFDSALRRCFNTLAGPVAAWVADGAGTEQLLSLVRSATDSADPQGTVFPALLSKAVKEALSAGSAANALRNQVVHATWSPWASDPEMVKPRPYGVATSSTADPETAYVATRSQRKNFEIEQWFTVGDLVRLTENFEQAEKLVWFAILGLEQMETPPYTWHTASEVTRHLGVTRFDFGAVAGSDDG